MKKKKIAIITSSEITITSFLIDYIEKLSEIYSVTLILNIKDTKKFINLFKNKEIKLINLKILRGIDLIQDIKSLFSLIKIFYKEKYNGIFSITPKAGLLSMLSGFLCRVKLRLHYFTGQVWVTRKGFQRIFLRNIDRLMGLMATHLLTDSKSQKKFLEDEKIIKKGRLKVLANGSICGVDTNQFKPDSLLKEKIRENLGISKESILLLFLGRLNRDKGILDLAKVLNSLNNNKDYKGKIHLLIIGPDEENIKQQVEFLCKDFIDNVHFMDFTDEPEKFMAAADIFCLPSYREGFGMAALEAGACALPTVASKIYGLTDAVSENETGLFHNPGDIKGIENAILKLVEDKTLRLNMGTKGRERTKNLFEKSYVINEFMDYLNNITEIFLRKKIVIISSTEISIRAFLQQQIRMLSEYYNVTLITNVQSFENLKKVLPKINIVDLNIKREISYFNDVACLVKLFFIFLRNRYQLVFSITPKGGFLSITSGYLARVKKRIHWYGGQVWVTRKGFQRIFLRNIDRLMGLMATNVLTECDSQKKFLEDEKIIKKGRLKVLANGSICGVDTNQFKPDSLLKEKIRENLGISKESILLLFLGRLNRDKGVLDLASAVKNLYLKDENKKIHLLIIGPDEENIKQQIEQICSEHLENIHFMDFTDEPEKFMAAADIFCLPSYREGFGMAALEAGACALPTVASKIYGLTDAVGTNSGLFHNPGDIKGIENAILKLVEDKTLRLNMGTKGRERTKNLFEKKYVTNEFVEYIKTLDY